MEVLDSRFAKPKYRLDRIPGFSVFSASGVQSSHQQRGREVASCGKVPTDNLGHFENVTCNVDAQVLIVRVLHYEHAIRACKKYSVNLRQRRTNASEILQIELQVVALRCFRRMGLDRSQKAAA